MKQFNTNNTEQRDRDILKILSALKFAMDAKGWNYTREDFEAVDVAVHDIELEQKKGKERGADGKSTNI